MNVASFIRSLQLAVLCFAVLCSHAQTQVALRIDHQAGQSEIAQTLVVETPAGESVEVDRLEYYLSGFTLVHDGGLETPIEGAFVLADAFVDELHPLGSAEGVNNVELLKFTVGVDPENNHADPVLWNADHPLAPQVPSMHWGWAAGYRFVALEGGSDGAPLEIHALGDDNHTPGEMEVLASVEDGVLVLDVEADVLGFFHLLTVGSGLINHSENEEAILVCNNLADRVFRMPGANGIDVQADVPFDFNLIARDGGARIQFDAALTAPLQVELLDILGRTLLTFEVAAGTRTYDLIDVDPGTFLISVTGPRQRFTRRWIKG